MRPPTVCSTKIGSVAHTRMGGFPVPKTTHDFHEPAL